MWVRMKARKKNQGSWSLSRRKTHSYKGCNRMTGAWPHLWTNPWCSVSVFCAESWHSRRPASSQGWQLEVLPYAVNSKLLGSNCRAACGWPCSASARPEKLLGEGAWSSPGEPLLRGQARCFLAKQACARDVSAEHVHRWAPGGWGPRALSQFICIWTEKNMCFHSCHSLYGLLRIV